MLVTWLKKTDFNAKVTEIGGKVPSISGLATNSALTVVNKINYLKIKYRMLVV